MYVMTDRGWTPLYVQCRNETWERVSWDERDKKYVSDPVKGTHMMCTGVLPGLPQSTDPLYSSDQPPRYLGKLPSPGCEAFIRTYEQMHKDWLAVVAARTSHAHRSIFDWLTVKPEG